MIDDFPDAKPGRIHAPAASNHSLERAIMAWTETTISKNAETESLHSDFLATIEPTFLQTVLKHTGGNRAKAAEMLGIHRGTLRDRLRGYGIDDSA